MGKFGHAVQRSDGGHVESRVSTGVLLLLARAQILLEPTFYPCAGYKHHRSPSARSRSSSSSRETAARSGGETRRSAVPGLGRSRTCTSLTPSPPALCTGKDGCYLAGDFFFSYICQVSYHLQVRKRLQEESGLFPGSKLHLASQGHLLDVAQLQTRVTHT